MQHYTPEDHQPDAHIEYLRGTSEYSYRKPVFLGIAVLVLLGGLVLFLRAQGGEEVAAPPIEIEATTTTTSEPEATTDPPETAAETTTSTTEAPQEPAIDPNSIAAVFVDRTPGDSYGTLGYLDTSTFRLSTDLPCGIVDYNENGGVCLNNGLGGNGFGEILDPSLEPVRTFSAFNPISASISPSGSVASWGGQLVGDRVYGPDNFETITRLIQADTGLTAGIEAAFVADIDEANDSGFQDLRRNYWSVSFLTDDFFYVSRSTVNSVFVAQGQVSTSRITVLYSDVFDPEISPDGTTLVAKEVRGDTTQLVAIDVTTANRRDLAESGQVIGQVEFFDDSTILYTLENDRGTEEEPGFDVWRLDINSGERSLFLANASSPAIP